LANLLIGFQSLWVTHQTSRTGCIIPHSWQDTIAALQY
jgi:hypothetical protein